jgi:hypothetical protein
MLSVGLPPTSAFGSKFSSSYWQADAGRSAANAEYLAT